MRVDCGFLLRAARLALVGACFASPSPLWAQAAPLTATSSPSWEWPGTPADLIRAVTEGSFQAMVRDFKPAYGIDRLPSVRLTSQCTRTAYRSKAARVCITPGISTPCALPNFAAPVRVSADGYRERSPLLEFFPKLTIPAFFRDAASWQTGRQVHSGGGGRNR